MFSAIQEDLIFDLGIHKGYDAEFYLKKGFRVVGLEAVPELANHCSEKLVKWGNRLTVINKALFHQSDQQVTFYTVPGKDDWGSLDQGIAEKGVETSVAITVETITLASLLDAFGTPRYIKCDMEGGDIIFRQQLLEETRRPRFVSVEMNDGREGEALAACGYDVGQIVNQWFHHFHKPPEPSKEGNFIQTTFTGEMSGLFGLDLAVDKWRPIAEVDPIYRRWKELRDIDQELAPGWVDLHATCRSCLA
jgi:FkbM family methyltransferase